MTRALVLLVLAACDPVWGIEVHVTDFGGAPVVGASLSMFVEDQNEHSPGSVATLTDEHGDAGLYGVGYLPPADIVIALPDFATYETSFDEVCHGDLDACDPIPHVDVLLGPAS